MCTSMWLVDVHINVASWCAHQCGWLMCTSTWLVNMHVDVIGRCACWCSWSTCMLTWLVNVHIDTVGRCACWCSWSTLMLTWPVDVGVNMADRTYMGQLGSTWPLICEWKGEPGGIKIPCSATYLRGPPLLGSPLVISDPSVATYDLLRLAHIARRCV